MTLEALNKLSAGQAKIEFSKCCGAKKWVDQMERGRPYKDVDGLLELAAQVWNNSTEEDWREAFTHHPKIGDVDSLEKKFTNTKEWAGNEQQSVETASRSTIEQLAEMNTRYEGRFGFIFIVCATGKSASEMLEILNSRIDNDQQKELRIAMEEQGKITALRLKKILT